jgi:D-glycero-beta-D-manno-heptose-7-phosphate kinase
MISYTSKQANEIFKRFRGLPVMVIGDVMIDSYLWGKVNRISPEAPVPIVSVNKRTHRLGGAANVALNLKALGAEPCLCSVIGTDEKAELFGNLLAENGLNTDGIIKSDRRITTTKFRVIGNNTQMLRVDEEMESQLEVDDYENFSSTIQRILQQQKIEAIIFQDYDKGVITPQLIADTVAAAKKPDIPVIVDPKKRNFSNYKNITLFKPNLKELTEGLGVTMEGFDVENLRRMVRTLHKQQQIDRVMVTLSEHGIFISRQTGNGQFEDHHLAAHLRSIADVSGAGDTVVSVAALALACGFSDYEIASISNLAGGQVCEQVGVAPVDKDKLMTEMLNRKL